MKWFATGAIVALVLLAGGALEGAESRSGVEELLGTWSVVAGECQGKPAPEDAFKDAKMVFARDRISAVSENGKSNVLAYKAGIAERLTTIDITNVETRQTILGIFVVKGNDLRLCLARPGSARPTTFSTKEGSGTVLFILRREK